MRAVLGVALVCFVSTLVYCTEAEEGATKPTPPEVIDAIKKLGAKVTVDKNKAVVSANHVVQCGNICLHSASLVSTFR